jgi:TolB-like protein
VNLSPVPLLLLLLRPALGALVVIAISACAGARKPDTSTVPRDSAVTTLVASERLSGVRAGAVGIPPFSASRSGSTSALAFALADLLATDLARSRQLTVVERGRLGEVLRELDLAQSGRVDSATAPRVGRLLGAERLLLGAIDSLPGGEFRIAVRVADVASGLVAGVIDASAPIAEVLRAEKELAFRVFEELGVLLTPAERSLVSAHPTKSVEALTAYGRGVAAEMRGSWQEAAEAFGQARRADAGFGLAGVRSAAATARATATAGTAALLPGIRGVDAPVISVVDRLNRPIDHITSQTRPLGGVGDPAFPGTLVTVVITVRRP